jgi:hypothetical protein
MLSRSSSNPRRSRTFQLESLEDRCTPSGALVPQAAIPHAAAAQAAQPVQAQQAQAPQAEAAHPEVETNDVQHSGLDDFNHAIENEFQSFNNLFKQFTLTVETIVLNLEHSVGIHDTGLESAVDAMRHESGSASLSHG